MKTYIDQGIKGLKEKPRTGHPAFLTASQQTQLAQFIKDKALNNDGGRY